MENAQPCGPRCRRDRQEERRLRSYRKTRRCPLSAATQHGGHMGSPRECTRILGLEGFRVETIEWAGDEPRAAMRIRIERRGIRGYECSGCRRRTWRVRDRAERTWTDVPWAEHHVT